MSKELSLKEVGKMLMEAQSLVLCFHVSPDGDALGSSVGLARFLKQQGKNVKVFVDDVVNDFYKFLPDVAIIQRPVLDEIHEADLLVVLDASSRDRIGIVGDCVKAKAILNIDHHISNTKFADYLYLDANAAATGEIMCELFEEMQWKMDKAIATLFYTAIVMDCGTFKFSCTSAKTMRMAANLLEAGVDPSDIAEVIDTQSRASMELLAKVLPSLSFAHGGKVGYLAIPNSLYNKSIHTDNFVNYARYIEGVDVAFMVKEVEPGVIRVSLRSTKAVDVSIVAAGFGGGGHMRAAGCTINAPLDEAIKQVLDALGKVL
ncbi:MAG: bifunctional oligoribonuclease/PAP phosphatase NrnA [Phascolarctobacterium sp.]|nr:bifunctional oligoribonuclease/PAP phosphatase NrnA [Phascolarctobacterium sp.]